MKPVGSKIEYEEERDRDLMSVYHDIISNRNTIKLREVMVELVNSPSKRFWVSEERALIVISAMMKGVELRGLRPMNKEKFNEIYRRVMIARKEHPNTSLYDLIFDVIRQPAPKFYLTPGSAKVIIHKIKKKWYKERMRKLRHLS